ncbi:MAG: hypothetical protein Q7V05_16030 [Methanoregula sp.]|nr:hypothetical protein [Methanoregula sp.]
MKYLLFIVLLVATIITAGCVGGNQNSVVTPSPPTLTVTITSTTTQQTNPQLESDKLFLSTAIEYNDEFSIATQIFAKILKEENRWLSNVKQTERDYQNALDDLEMEKSIASDLNLKYNRNMQNAGSDVSLARIYTMAYNQNTADQTKLITLAQNVVDVKKAVMDAAKKPIDLKSKGLDVNVLNATCTRAIDQLTPIEVSSELQPTKDQYLTAISNFKKGGDCVATAVNYYNQGQVSSGTDSYDKGIAYIETGTNQLDSSTLLLQQYKTRMGK